MLKSRFAALLLLVIASNPVLSGDSWDQYFGIPGSSPGGVAAVVVFANKLIVGGNFTSIGGVTATNLAQWDGTTWAPVGGGVGGVVYALAVSAGQLFVGGHFSQVGAVRVNNVARWNGTEWSALGEGVNDVVFALASEATNLYAGGHFTTAGTNQVGKLARWDGTAWYGLGLGIVPVGPVGVVGTLAVSGDELYVGGDFRVAGGIAATNIARWDGASWHDLGGGLRNFDYGGAENGGVGALVVDQGILYAAGEFRLAGSSQATNIAAWDGTRWSDLSGGVNGLGSISALAFNGRDLFTGGGFTNIGGVSASRLAKWNGRSWSSLGSGVSYMGGLSGTVFGLASTGSELVAVGIFTSAGGQPSTNIALWRIPHELAIQRSQADVKLSWPGTGSNFVLEACSSLSATNWRAVPLTPSLENGEWVVTKELVSTNEIYRLRRR